MTVVGSHAYLLELENENLVVHELDLQTWRWRCLQYRQRFRMDQDDSLATALLDVRNFTTPICPCTMVSVCKHRSRPSQRCFVLRDAELAP